MRATLSIAALLLALALAPAQPLAAQAPDGAGAHIFGLLELPFLLVSLVFAFLTARALRGGAFGTGMNLIAWGFLVMAVGHLHLQIDHYFGVNLFGSLLGATAGSIAWFVALVVTWGLTGLGFYSIYQASSGGSRRA